MPERGWAPLGSLAGMESFFRLTNWEVAPETFRRKVAATTGWAYRRQRQITRGATGLAGTSSAIGARIANVERFGVADPGAWRLGMNVEIPEAQQILFTKSSPFTSLGTVNLEKVWDPYLRAVGEAGAQGIVAATSKPEDIVRGIFSRLRPTDVSVAGQFFRGDKAGLYQNITFPTMAPKGVAALEVGLHGRQLPRLVTPQMAAQRLGQFGQARPQEVMLQAAILSPRSRWGRTLAQGALESEIGFVSELVGGTSMLMPGGRPSRHPLVRGAKAIRSAGAESIARFGRFNAAMFMGQKKFLGGALTGEFTQRTGVGLLVAQELGKDPAALLSAMLQDVVASAAMESRSTLRHRLPRVMSKFGMGDLDLRNSLAVLTPSQGLMEAGLAYATKRVGGMQGMAAERYGRMSREVLAFRGAFSMIRGMARELGLPVPLRQQTLAGIGSARVLTGALSPRGYHPAVLRGLRADPTSLLGLAAQGPVSAGIAGKLQALAVHQAGPRAQQWFAMFNPMLGRRFGPKQMAQAGFREIGIWDIDPVLGKRLNNLRTAGDVRSLLRSGVLPRGPTLLRLPEAVRLPTLGLLEQTRNMSRRRAGQIFRTQGVATKHLALPSLEGELRRIAGSLAHDEAVFLPPALRRVGSILTAAQHLGQARSAGLGTEAVSRAQAALLGRTYGYLRTLGTHTGAGRMIEDLLKPRLRTGPGGRTGSIFFRQLTTGFDAAKLGLGGDLMAPDGVRVGELGISRAAAKRLGIQDLAGEHFVLGQFFPQAVPGTSSTFKLRVLADQALDENTIVTNVANRLQAFRDLDWDQMQIALFPSTVSRREQRRAWRESMARSHRFWRNVPHDVRAQLRGQPFEKALAGMLQRGPLAGWTKEQLVKALRQKALPGLYYEPTMAMRDILFREFGSASYAGQQAIGVAYQLAGIKKSLAGEELSALHSYLAGVPGRAGAPLGTHIAETERLITRMAGTGRGSDVILGLSRTEQRTAAEQLVTAANIFNRMPDAERRATLGRLGSGAALPLSGMLRQLANAGPGFRNQFTRGLLGMGELVRHPSEAARGIAGANAATRQKGALGRAAGGIWARTRQFWNEAPKPLRYAAAGIGALLGLRVVMSHLFGDEPAPAQGMNISPELAARMAMQQQEMGSAPLPAEPMLGQGIHGSAISRPHVPFSPPPARITSSRQSAPKVRITGDDTGGADTLGLGHHLAHSLRTVVDNPQVRVLSSDASHMTRLDLMVDRQMRAENRLYG